MGEHGGLGRRRFLASTAALPLLGGACRSAPSADVFPLGVASGDPATDRVVLWTALSRFGSWERSLRYELFSDAEGRDRVRHGELSAGASTDWTTRVDVEGLSPATTYYYRFEHSGVRSPMGRTRTLPEATEELRVAVLSCASYAHGFFHVYRHVAERADIDLVLHLGDYIYEYADREYGELRGYDPPHEARTLDDYRRRYRHYRADADLQALHQQHPIVALWDDHEIADNAFTSGGGGAFNHHPWEGAFADRRAAATQAFHEYLPLRTASPEKIWRALSVGDLLDLRLVDARLWGRDPQVDLETDRADPSRQLLGADQERWLIDGVQASSARWQLLAQQPPFSPITVAPGEYAPYNLDQWDGYSGARRRLLEGIAGRENVVLLAGDIHSAWGMEVSADPFDAASYDPATGEGAVAVELVTSSVTTPTWASEGFAPRVEADLRAWNPHVRHLNFRQRGWLELTLRPEAVSADFHVVDGTDLLTGRASLDRSWVVQSGAPRLELAPGPGRSTRPVPPLAPGPPPRNFPGAGQ
jgi:alkaline phosphatase D